jgi:glycyl-tRNA synthetase
MENSIQEKIVSLCKRRGFVFPSSEIYGGFSGVYDYGPMGVELENNLKAEWWKAMVQKRSDIVGLDSGIFMDPRIWEASGHVKGFSDPLVECKVCNVRSRADHLLEAIGVVADEKMTESEINEIFTANLDKIECPKCGSKKFTSVKAFNLLVKSNLGDFSNNNSSPVYLRGETCQGIYVNYKNVADSMHLSLPFGVAQIGKAFRNEIAARQFIFRTREFEQMEMQYFLSPEQEMSEYEKLKDYRWKALLALGIKEENLKWHKHENLVFYAKEAYDIEYNFPFGWKELEGIHARGNYDLTQHSTHSGQDLSYFDQQKAEKYIPHVIESSIGVGRLLLAVISDAYHEEEVDGETRVVLKFSKKVAPIKIAVLPLSKKEELSKRAREVFDMLTEDFRCQYDETQSIGKRYRRQDEIGTPFCITYDFDSINDNSVTVRDRDTMKQDRIKISELRNYMIERLK